MRPCFDIFLPMAVSMNFEKSEGISTILVRNSKK